MKKKIIVVEDDDDIRDIVGYLLEEQYDVTLCADIKHFRRNLSQVMPDLVLMDVMLPDGDGRHVCMEMKADPNSSDVPVLLMSAHCDAISLDCNAAGFITKPFENADLKLKVAYSLATA